MSLPTHSRLDALVAHSKSRPPAFGRPVLRWAALATIIVAAIYFLSPWGLEDGSPSGPWRETLGDTWVKVKENVPWVRPPNPVVTPTAGGVNPNWPEVNNSSPTAEQKEDPVVAKDKWAIRKQKVKNAFARAYVGYRTHAYPKDELLPVSGGGSEKINGWSLTSVEALSTMWLMDMKTEFWRTVRMLERKKFVEHSAEFIPFFETVIRYLGGYLSAYALSGEKLLLTMADDIGMQLLPAFKTESGLPAGNVMAGTGRIRPGGSVLAEIASCQLEFKYLAKETGRAEYYERAEGVMQTIYNSTSIYRGLLPEHWDINQPVGTGTGRHFAIGGNADSAYEYLLKQFLQAGDRQALDMYLKSMKGVIENLLYISPERGLLYVTDIEADASPGADDEATQRPIRPSHKLEHLSCFLPGLLALGAYQVPLHTHDAPPPPPPDPEALKLGLSTRPEPNDGTRPWLTPWELEHKFPEEERQKHMWAAEGLAYTCWTIYADQLSGIGVDEVFFQYSGGGGGMGGSRGGERWVDVLDKWKGEREEDVERRQEDKPPGTREPPPEHVASKRDYTNSWPDKWLMRPETIESIYILWKTTKNPVWRERGWKIFESIEKWAKTPYGYASLNWVDKAEAEGGPTQMDDMPSYFLAETLKYLYLLFDDEDPIKFDQWVFNTEAHPLPVFNWTARERERFIVAY